MTPRIVVGLDPSIAAFGWAVLDHAGGTRIIDMGSWRTSVDERAGKFADRGRRSEEIGRQAVALFAQHRPVSAFIEAPIFKPTDGKMSMHASARVRGGVEWLCLAMGIPLAELAPQDVKRALLGDAGGSKEQVARRLFLLFGRDLRIERADDNATDALAVAFVGAGRKATMVSSGVVQHREAESDDGLLDL